MFPTYLQIVSKEKMYIYKIMHTHHLYIYIYIYIHSFSGSSDSKETSAMRETRVWSLGWEDPLEKEMATHSNILARRILWTEHPGRPQSMGLQRDTTEQLSHIKLYIYVYRERLRNKHGKMLTAAEFSYKICNFHCIFLPLLCGMKFLKIKN